METGHWITLKEDSDYEMFDEYPHQIRRKKNKRIIKYSNCNEYIQCHLNRKHYLLHRIIANNFIENPNNHPFVDHKNHITTDNRIENLRWVSIQENNQNRKSMNKINYEFIDTLNDNAIQLTEINNQKFNRLYYQEGELYYYDGLKYRKLIKHYTGNQWRISIQNINNKKVLLSKYQIENALGFKL